MALARACSSLPLPLSFEIDFGRGFASTIEREANCRRKRKQFLCDEIAEIMEVQGCSENATHSRIRRGPCHKEFSWRDLFSSGRDCIAGRFALNLLRFSVFCMCVGGE